MARGNRFSIFDAMEKAGKFESNPANSFSRDNEGLPLYTGPVPYPKMLYHPDGEEEVIVPGVWEVNKAGREIYLGEQRQLVTLTVNSVEEEKKAVEGGWHDHPARAIKVRVEGQIAAQPQMGEKEKAALLASIPPMPAGDYVKKLESDLAKALAEKDKLEAAAADADAA